MGIGLGEILIILIIVLILFGPKKLPELAKALGKAVNEYKRAVEGNERKRKRVKKKLAG